MKQIIPVIYRNLRKILFSHRKDGYTYSSGYWPDKIRKMAVEIFLEKDYSGKNILDSGSGEGLLISDIKNTENYFHCIDLSPKLLELNIESNWAKNIFFVNGNSCFLPYKNESFDFVFMLNLVLNIPSLELLTLIFCEISRVLKKDGLLLFDIRNSNSMTNYMRFRLIKFYDPSAPVHFHATAGIIELTGKFFKITEVRNIGLFNNTKMLECKKKCSL